MLCYPEHSFTIFHASYAHLCYPGQPVLSKAVVCYSVQSNAFPNNSVLSWAIQWHPKQSCTILSNHMLFQVIFCYPELSSSILKYSKQSWNIQSNPVLSLVILCYPWQSCAILYNPVLSCTVLCYPEPSSLLSKSILSYPSLYTYLFYIYQHIMTLKSQVWQTDWHTDSRAKKKCIRVSVYSFSYPKISSTILSYPSLL